MENDFENKVKKGIEKFHGKSAKVTISGIIESKFYMKNVKYEIEEGVLVIEDGDDAYLDVDIDDVESVYSEFTTSGYALLVLKVGRDLQIELQTKDDNVIPIRDKLWRRLVKSGFAEELYKEVCGAWNFSTMSRNFNNMRNSFIVNERIELEKS